KVQVSDSSAAVEFAIGAGRVRVQKSPLQIVFLDASEKVVLSDARPMAFSGSSFLVWKAMPDDEHFYGLIHGAWLITQPVKMFIVGQLFPCLEGHARR